MTNTKNKENEMVCDHVEPMIPKAEKIISMKIIFNNGKRKRYILPKDNFDVEDGFILIMKTEKKGVGYPLSQIKKIKIKEI